MDTDKGGGKRWKKTKKELIVYSAHLAGKSKGALASQRQKVGGGGWGSSLNLFVQKREVKGVPSILVGKSSVLSKERKRSIGRNHWKKVLVQFHGLTLDSILF